MQHISSLSSLSSRTGQTIQTRHISNGVEIQPVGVRLSWNDSYQVRARGERSC